MNRIVLCMSVALPLCGLAQGQQIGDSDELVTGREGRDINLGSFKGYNDAADAPMLFHNNCSLDWLLRERTKRVDRSDLKAEVAYWAHKCRITHFAPMEEAGVFPYVGTGNLRYSRPFNLVNQIIVMSLSDNWQDYYCLLVALTYKDGRLEGDTLERAPEAWLANAAFVVDGQVTRSYTGNDVLQTGRELDKVSHFLQLGDIVHCMNTLTGWYSGYPLSYLAVVNTDPLKFSSPTRVEVLEFMMPVAATNRLQGKYRILRLRGDAKEEARKRIASLADVLPKNTPQNMDNYLKGQKHSELLNIPVSDLEQYWRRIGSKYRYEDFVASTRPAH